MRLHLFSRIPWPERGLVLDDTQVNNHTGKGRILLFFTAEKAAHEGAAHTPPHHESRGALMFAVQFARLPVLALPAALCSSSLLLWIFRHCLTKRCSPRFLIEAISVFFLHKDGGEHINLIYPQVKVDQITIDILYTPTSLTSRF